MRVALSQAFFKQILTNNQVYSKLILFFERTYHKKTWNASKHAHREKLGYVGMTNI